MAKRERLDPPNERRVDLFLDSGVFSAWNRQTTLDIKKYCDFIKRNEHILACYATMDVIPGQFGVKRTQKDLEDSAAASYDNQQIMKGRGLKPIPIFHQGEPYTWLERYIKDGEPYIGISTAKDLRNDEQRQWLDLVFSMITDAKGRPHIKTHGFGITNISLLLRYPWYTADSTTWSLAAGFGLIYVPKIDHAVPDYNSIPMRIITSGRTQKAWSSSKRQYEALNAENVAWVQRWMKHVEVTPDEARHRSSARRLACVKYFNEFSQHHVVKPFPLRHRVKRLGILEPVLDLHLEGNAPEPWPRMKVMMATMMHNGQFSLILNKADARNRLVSYWEIMNRDEKLLHNFVQDGITDINYQPRKMRLDWENETYLSNRAMMLLERIKQYGTEEDRGSAD